MRGWRGGLLWYRSQVYGSKTLEAQNPIDYWKFCASFLCVTLNTLLVEEDALPCTELLMLNICLSCRTSKDKTGTKKTQLRIAVKGEYGQKCASYRPKGPGPETAQVKDR